MRTVCRRLANYACARHKLHHNNYAANPTMATSSRMHLCSICNDFAGASFSSVLCHIGDVHKSQIGPAPTVAVWCGIDGCPRSYENYESFRSHVYRKHSHMLRLCVDTRSTPSGDPDLHLDGEDQEPDDIASHKVSI